ncbi:MAG: tRNA pseudouridine(38-40) synthase TruA [Gammaproteobacteria bacterium]|nr:MAG: tRNA pseudouridine(38-40) synthase TruA [Gammaproteobacteria bacterium]
MSGASRRIAVGVEYDGTRYAGWQAQRERLTVQAEVERALGAVAAHPVTVVCAGRTDAGVHASGQVAHFDTSAVRPLHGWVLGANRHLPTDVALRWAASVADDFHARYSAIARTYRYLILHSRTRPVLLHARVCHVRAPLDAPRMHEAAQALVGEHDFSAFRSADCQAPSAVRRLEAIQVLAHGPFVTIEVTANAFLHHMVRNIAGALLAVGAGDRPPAWVATVLAGRDRGHGGITAPAAGLYLVDVRYPDNVRLPDLAGLQPSAMIAGLIAGWTQ